MSKFGALIRECRIAADKTLHSAADLLGVSAYCLEEVELGLRPAYSRARIEKLAAFYGVDSEPLIVEAWRERGLIELDMTHASPVQFKALLGIVRGNPSEEQWEAIYRVVNRNTQQLVDGPDHMPKISAFAKAAAD